MNLRSIQKWQDVRAVQTTASSQSTDFQAADSSLQETAVSVVLEKKRNNADLPNLYAL